MKIARVFIAAWFAAFATGCIDFSELVDDYCVRFPQECSVAADAGGTDAGGTDAGGTDAGGTDAGGTDAGPNQYTLTLVAPTGGVVRPDGGQPCPGFCSPRLVEVGATVNLLAEPSPMHALVSWTGDCAFAGDAGACGFEMPARDVTVSATFVPLDTLTLTVASMNGGDGGVTIMPGTFTCTPAISPCAVTQPRGTMLQLVATPDSLSALTSWSSPCTPSSATCGVTLNGNVSIAATFERLGQLQVTLDPADAGARVVSADGGIDCPGRCSLATIGPVTLTAIERPGVLLERWEDTSVSPQRTVQVSSGATAQVTASFQQVNVIFFTRQSVPYASAQEADTACSNVARDAGLGSAYVAWLSTPTSGAASRLLAVAPALADAGWVRTDNLPFTRSLGRLVNNGEVLYPVGLDEHGVAAGPGDVVLTGTTDRGEPGLPCFDANATVHRGSPFGGSLAWTNAGLDFSGCGNSRLYCLGTAHRSQPPLRQPMARRRAFLGATGVYGTDGLPGGDQLCRQEAMNAGLQGSFKALLGYDGGAPIDRFDAGSPGWYRVDGVPWAVPAAELWSNQPRLQSALNVSARGEYLTPSYVWTQAFTPSMVDDGTTLCTSGTANGVVGNPVTSGDGFFQGNGRPCSDLLPVYCLEE